MLLRTSIQRTQTLMPEKRSSPKGNAELQRGIYLCILFFPNVYRIMSSITTNELQSLECCFYKFLNWDFRCDRILWRGNGIEQLSYIRGESRFSDHRPVCAVFAAEVEVRSRSKNRYRNGYSYTVARLEYDECIPQRHSFYDF